MAGKRKKKTNIEMLVLHSQTLKSLAMQDYGDANVRKNKRF